VTQTTEYREQRANWETRAAQRRGRAEPGAGALDRTISDMPLKMLYGRRYFSLDPARDLAFPGEYPYTRGIHPAMYRERLWTMRQFAGFGNAQQTK